MSPTRPPSDTKRLYAVRGATTVRADTRDEIVGRTLTVLKELLARNAIDPDDIVSILFTATDDLHAEFPAVAARQLGLNSVALMCARELDVRTSSLSIPRCIRILMHYYGDGPPEAVYLEDAERILDKVREQARGPERLDP